MQKKAQLSFFVAAGVVILLAVGIFLLSRSGYISEKIITSTQKDLELGDDIESVERFVTSCLEDVAKINILSIASGGGYYLPPRRSTDTGIAFYFDRGDILLPAKERIEQEIVFSVEQELRYCTKGFKAFKKLKVTEGDIKAKAQIFDTKILIDIEYPLTVDIKGSVSKLSEFKAEIPIRLGRFYSVTEFLVKDQNINPKLICSSCYLVEAMENDIYYSLSRTDDNVVVVTAEDFNVSRDTFSFNFSYAMRF